MKNNSTRATTLQIMSLSLRYKLLRQASSAQRAQECRLSGMEAPENLTSNGAVSPAEPVTGLNMAKTQPRPD
ncbi:hypothetical protein PANT111_310001 [Pantoea brenneri]|uniref:Transposase n=1 Tax=Pantoea brenneri TaxID=472694 RepID=A0AAX3J9Q9_9GAMM|nr:hypothetical protein PANT111_310001 [Pantoea brenneri]